LYETCPSFAFSSVDLGLSNLLPDPYASLNLQMRATKQQ